MSGASLALLGSTFLAAFVEFVEALTIVLAMGVTRGWRSALAGVGAAVTGLVVFTAAAGYALRTWLPEAALQLVIGTLLLIFGLQWLRKATLRSAGLKAMHDEDAAYAAQTAAARARSRTSRFGIDTFAFVVSMKGVFLEGVEVVFIVITFGLNADDVSTAAIGATAAGVVVVGAGLLVHRPLAAVPENTLKYGVGLMLAAFGTFWCLEGLGVLRAGRDSLAWPGHDWAIPVLVAGWFVVSRVLVAVLPKVGAAATGRRTGEEVAA